MSGRVNVYRASVHGLLSGQVTVQSSYCPVGLLSGRATVFVHRATACRKCVHGEVSIELVSGRATARIPFRWLYVMKQKHIQNRDKRKF